MANINSLEDKLLLAIFTRLPVTDLYRLNLVCTKWATLQPAACAPITVLYIQVFGIYRQLKNHRFTIPRLGDVEGEVADDRTRIDYALPFNRLQFHLLTTESVCKVAKLFRGIQSFEISVESVPAIRYIDEERFEAFEPIVDLVKSWSSSLVNLSIFNRFCGFEQYIFDPILRKLTAALNSCLNLKHLTLEIQNSFDYSGGLKPEFSLPILRQLVSFYWNFPDLNEQVWKNLEVYGRTNADLKSIGFGNVSKGDLEEDYFKNTAKYGDIYEKLHFLEFFHIRSKPHHIPLICTRFTHLKRILLCFDKLGILYGMLGNLVSLKQLLCLDLHFYLEDTEEPVDWNQLNAERDLPVLESVKILNIVADIRSHEEMKLIQWKTMLPKLEILMFTDTYSTCKDCNCLVHDRLDDEKHLQCLRLAMKAWNGCKRLKRIYVDFNGKLQVIQLDPVL